MIQGDYMAGYLSGYLGVAHEPTSAGYYLGYMHKKAEAAMEPANVKVQPVQAGSDGQLPAADTPAPDPDADRKAFNKRLRSDLERYRREHMGVK